MRIFINKQFILSISMSMWKTNDWMYLKKISTINTSLYWFINLKRQYGVWIQIIGIILNISEPIKYLVKRHHMDKKG